MNEKTKNALLSIVASLVCIVIGLLVGFIILYCINAENAVDGFTRIIKGGFYLKPKGIGSEIAQSAPLIMTGLSVAFAFKTGLFNNGSDAGNGAASAKLNYTNAAFIYKIGPFTVNIFLFIGIILLICSYVFLFKTKWGLRLRACGEHPQAADSVGINVYQWRYTGVIISGALGGIGGFAYIVPSVTTWNFEVGVAGAGFLALAVMIFGQWKPFHIAGAAVFFAVFRSLANIADSTVLSHLGLSKNIYNMMPFIASMIILAFTSKNSQAPKAEGIPYDKGAR